MALQETTSSADTINTNPFCLMKLLSSSGSAKLHTANVTPFRKRMMMLAACFVVVLWVQEGLLAYIDEARPIKIIKAYILALAGQRALWKKLSCAQRISQR